jgi:hypothetical protein
VKHFFEKIFPLLLIFIVSVFAFRQIAFFQNTFKYDFIEQCFPLHYYISECIKSGFFPLWNPYLNIGYPIHADPLSGIYYPITWLTSTVFGYNIYSMSFEFILHIFLAGVGMYYLSGVLKFEKLICLLTSISFMLCGVFIGNAQHYPIIISGTWIPFVIAAAIQLSEKTIFRNAIKLAFFSFLLFSGGYPAFYFILFYFILIFIIYKTVIHIYKKEYKIIFKTYIFYLLAVLIFTLLSAGLIVSIYESLPYITRSNGVDLEKALYCPFSPKCFISFVLPFASVKEEIYNETDLSMSNGYFGIFIFLFFLISIFYKKPSLIWLFLIFGFFSLIAAVGDYLPVRTFLYKYIPLMNMFRFPSLFRLFAIIGFIISAGWYLNELFIKQNIYKLKILKYSWGILILGLLFVIIFCSTGNDLDLIYFVRRTLLKFSAGTDINQHIVFQSLIQIFFILIFIIFSIILKNSKKIFVLLTVLVASELIVSTQLNSAYTVFNDESDLKEISKNMRKFPHGFPLPNNNFVIKNSDTTSTYVFPFWKNRNIFWKQIASDGYNPFQLKTNTDLQDNYSDFYFSFLSNKPVFLSSNIHSDDSLKEYRQKKYLKSDQVFFSNNDYELIKKTKTSHSSEDTAFIYYFSPNKISVSVCSAQPQVLVLLQNNYSGWHAYVNGKESKIITANHSIISLLIPEGTNKIIFEYKPKNVILCSFISIFSLIITLFYFALSKIFLLLKKRYC